MGEERRAVLCVFPLPPKPHPGSISQRMTSLPLALPPIPITPNSHHHPSQVHTRGGLSPSPPPPFIFSFFKARWPA